MNYTLIRFTPEQEKMFIENLEETEKRKDWTASVEFSIPFLLENSSLFFEIIVMRAVKEAKGKHTVEASDLAAEIFDELGLKLVLNSENKKES